MRRSARTARLVFAAAAVAALATALPAHAFRMIQNFTVGRVTAGIPVPCNDPGGFAHWNQFQIDWRHNLAGQGSDKAFPLAEAMRVWTLVPGTGHFPRYAGTTAGVFATDGINAIRFGTGDGCSGTCLALTALVLQAGQVIVESDITFNSSHTWRTNGTDQDTQGVAAHELGHSMGLHHTDQTAAVPTPTMVGGNPGGSVWRTLEADDRGALVCVENRFPTGGCEPLVSASVTGPTQLNLHQVGTFTASGAGGTGPRTHTWSIRFHHPTFGWGVWSTPFSGGTSTTASSNTCGHNRFELRVELGDPDCPSTFVASRTVDIVNFACPW